jgi:hypothetical protein
MYIVAKRKTVVKSRLVDSKTLGTQEILWIDQGRKLEIDSITEELSQHRFVELADAIGAFDEGFIYIPHWEFTNPTPKGDVILNVPYFEQLDNSTVHHGAGSRQCNITSNAMAAEFILGDRSMQTLSVIARQKRMSEAESAYGEMVYAFGDTTDHNANTFALHRLKLESYWSTELEISDIISSINKRLPMPLGMHYKDSGHIVCAVGYNLDREIIYINDPFGARAGSQNYYAVVGNGAGKFDTYTFNTMRKIWTASRDGWGRVFTAIGGVKTGL